MRRHLFTFASVVSLLLFAAAILVWGRSYWYGGELGWSAFRQGPPEAYYEITGNWGRSFHSRTMGLNIVRVRGNEAPRWLSNDLTNGPPSEFEFREYPFDPAYTPDDPRTIWERMGFIWFARFWRTPAGRAFQIDIEIPIWLVATGCLVLPTLWIAHRLFRRRWRLHGRCANCGYALTGNTSGVCPECGAACKAADPAGVSPAAGD